VKPRIVAGAVAAVLVVIATAVAVVLAEHPSSAPTTTSSGLSVVRVQRGNLTVKTTAGGTLGGTPAPLAFTAQTAGVVTELPPVGSTIIQGQVLYRLDNEPVVLLYGSTPIYRPFTPGMPAGPDVVELEQDLINLGFGQPYGLTANGDFNFADEQAVRAFNEAEGLPSGDSISEGSVLFEPGPVFVAAVNAGLGQAIATGGSVVTLDLGAPSVAVQLPSGQAAGIEPGTQASVRLSAPSTVLPGTVTSVAAGSGGNIAITLHLTNPPADLSLAAQSVFVVFDVQVLHNVYVVPIAALVATIEGGYAVQERLPGGRTRYVGVTVGAIDNLDSLAQVSGAGLYAGMPIETAS
jgi:peptidoglycan hydrolase-like protein with peptidoglycan-binding domain